MGACPPLSSGATWIEVLGTMALDDALDEAAPWATRLTVSQVSHLCSLITSCCLNLAIVAVLKVNLHPYCNGNTHTIVAHGSNELHDQFCGHLHETRLHIDSFSRRLSYFACKFDGCGLYG